MLRRSIIAAIAAAAFAFPLVGGGCSNRDVMNLPDLEDAAVRPPEFSQKDAAAPPQTLTEYCPTTSCPLPYTACPKSQYPCDVNLMTDPLNCGACGLECKGSGNAIFDCVAGECTFRCRAENSVFTADCNGILDDDCEVTLGTNDNCNGCGDRCPDPARPCIFDKTSGVGKCGCDDGKIYCGNQCVDPATADRNCGGCGNVCNPADGGDAGPPPANAYYGCSESECGHLKCLEPYADCDQVQSNGCETSLVTDDNCGACGAACLPGQACVQRPSGIQCLCPPGQTLCGSSCVDLATNPSHCGACFSSCLLLGVNENNVATCNYGSCTTSCRQGWGDCNGDPSDGCEVNLSSDQRHCGACGNECDALAGQPCIGGQCAVHACGEGEEAR